MGDLVLFLKVLGLLLLTVGVGRRWLRTGPQLTGSDGWRLPLSAPTFERRG
mgnify:CR=1 FL=1